MGYAPEVWEGYGRAGVKRPFYGTANVYNRRRNNPRMKNKPVL